MNVGWRKGLSSKKGIHHFYLEDDNPFTKSLCNSVKLARTEMGYPSSDKEKCTTCLTKVNRLGITENKTFIASFELIKVPRKS